MKLFLEDTLTLHTVCAQLSTTLRNTQGECDFFKYNAASPHCSPTKSTFIKAKYQRLAFVPRLPCKDDDTITVSDLSQVTS